MIFPLRHPGTQIYAIYILKHYFKPENKTDNLDFTKFGMKIGPVPDLQDLSPWCKKKAAK